MALAVSNFLFSMNFSLAESPVFAVIEAGETVSTVELTDNGGLSNFGTIEDGLHLTHQGQFTLINEETGVIGTPDGDANVVFSGTGAAAVSNVGLIEADLQLGLGADNVVNSGTLNGDVRTSGGKDTLTNSGVIDGTVQLGSGNDKLYNTGDISGRVNLGLGDDFYTATNGGNFSSTDYSAGRIQGGAGRDRMFGGGNEDTLDGGQGEDDLRGHDGDDTLNGGQGQDVLRGGEGEDRLIGGISGDRLFGGNGDDDLFGGSGQDFLVGGRGDDELTGGSGADTFKFEGQSGADVITDFRAQDSVRLFVDGAAVSAADIELLADIDVDAFLFETDAGVKLDLDALYTLAGRPDLSGGGSENSITFADLSIEDLSIDQFI
ncbi:MAG: calcium-binding protein [Aliishimia sp.]